MLFLACLRDKYWRRASILGWRAQIDLPRGCRGAGNGTHAAADDGAAGDAYGASDDANGSACRGTCLGTAFHPLRLAAAASGQDCDQS
jgi:hypothetical protein